MVEAADAGRVIGQSPVFEAVAVLVGAGQAAVDYREGQDGFARGVEALLRDVVVRLLDLPVDRPEQTDQREAYDQHHDGEFGEGETALSLHGCHGATTSTLSL